MFHCIHASVLQSRYRGWSLSKHGLILNMGNTFTPSQKYPDSLCSPPGIPGTRGSLPGSKVTGGEADHLHRI